MTATQLDKMRAGRERQLAELREQHATMQAAYQRWVRHESESFAIRAQTEHVYGRDSDEFREANEVWSRVLASMPSLSFAWHS